MGLSVDGASDSTSSKVGDTKGEAVKSEPTCCCDLVSGDIDGGLGPDPPAASGLGREITCSLGYQPLRKREEGVGGFNNYRNAIVGRGSKEDPAHTVKAVHCICRTRPRRLASKSHYVMPKLQKINVDIMFTCCVTAE